MRVVLYERYSSEKQNEQSIEGQDKVCREYCARKGWDIVDVYRDRETSAFKDVEKRESFQQMIKDSALHKFDAVVVYKIDRFSRNNFDYYLYEKLLKENGVAIYSAQEFLGDGPERIIMESVMVGMAQYYSLELSQKVKRGMALSAEKAQSNGGATLLGYKVVNKKYVIDEVTSQWVREAFERYANGDSCASIVEDFNNRGYKTSRGGKFNKNTFGYIFRNEKYMGVYRFDNIVVEGGIPAIVSKELFEEVRAKANRLKSSPQRNRAKANYLLSARVYCGCCCGPMVGTSGYGKQKVVYNYYVCNNKDCGKTKIRKEVLEDLCLDEVKKAFTPDLRDELAQGIIEMVEEENRTKHSLTLVDNEIKTLERKVNNLIEVIADSDGIDLKPVKAKLSEFQSALKVAKSRKEQIKKETITVSKEEVLEAFDKILDNAYLGTEYDKEVQEYRKLVFSIVQAVQLTRVGNNVKLMMIISLDDEGDRSVVTKEILIPL